MSETINTKDQILSSLSRSWKISKREFKTAFTTPIAYTVIVIFLFVQGWFFWMPFFLKNQATMRDFFSLLPLILTFIVPAYTMRLFSEEIAKGSYELIATLPVSRTDIIIGKFLSSVLFIAVLLLPTLFYPISIGILGDLDWGTIIGGYLGAILLGSVYSAIGIFTSSLTRDQITSFIIAVAISFALYIISSVLIFLPNAIVPFFQYLSTGYHFQSISKGIVDFRDLVYFLSMIFVFLFATRQVMTKKA